MSVALSIAMQQNRILVIDPSSWPELLKDCDEGSHSCFFKDLSYCQVDEASIASAPVYDDKKKLQSDRILKFELKKVVAHTAWKYRHVPDEFTKQGKDLLWYRSMLLSYILRPLDLITEEI